MEDYSIPESTDMGAAICVEDIVYGDGLSKPDYSEWALVYMCSYLLPLLTACYFILQEASGLCQSERAWNGQTRWAYARRQTSRSRAALAPALLVVTPGRMRTSHSPESDSVGFRHLQNSPLY